MIRSFTSLRRFAWTLSRARAWPALACRLLATAAVALFLLSLPACASPSAADSRAAFVDRMVKTHGFARRDVQSILARISHQQPIIAAISRPAEQALLWRDYRKIFLTEQRIAQGLAFWSEHEAALQRASQTYKVEPEVILAIIGVETSYGRNVGKYRVLDALGTLGFGYPPRAEFFLTELENFLLLCREQNLDINSVVGSYAGAMGYGQFIPSSYRNFAVDFSGDGRADIIANPTDAIGSVANYFERHGWQMGAPVALPLTPPGSAFGAVANLGTEPKDSLGELVTRGLTAGALRADEKVVLFKFDGEQGDEYWAGLKNFYVITRYNRSPMYALAVHQLSKAIAAARNAPRPEGETAARNAPRPDGEPAARNAARPVQPSPALQTPALQTTGAAAP